MTAHRVLVCGGRDFGDAFFVRDRLAELRQMLGDFAVIQGGACGADRLAKEWAQSAGLPSIEVAANWTHYGKGAGATRNSWMLDFCFPTYAVAFPGGPGTADMARKCEARGVPVWRL